MEARVAQHNADGLCFNSQQKQVIIYFSPSKCPDRLWGPTHPPIQLVTRALSPVIKISSSEADCSLPYSAEVTNEWSHASTCPYFLWWT
jgi:hypothetical protein